MIGSKLAHYEIVEKIGEGGMGAVYRARDTKLGREVAVKVLPQEMSSDPERRKRFDREARSIAALKHPNIVTIHSVEESDGHYFLTMELVEGKTVSDLLPSDGFALARFFDIAIPLADAVNSAHASGITHRDLKPSNIMIDKDGRVKVLDFGLAKLFEPTDSEVAQAQTIVDDGDTQEGKVVGTVAYMSPEQAEGKSIDHRSDIFSLGIVLYEMATGNKPFKGDSSLSLLSSILKDTPSAVTDIRGHLPVQMGRIIQHCLEKDPRKRFQNALDIANELEALQTEVSSATGAIEAVHAPRFRVGKTVGISGVVVAALIIAFLIFKPFSVEITPDQDAVALGNKLAVMYFENFADADDPKRYGEIVGELLITGLSEADNLSVVSSQRLYDILKQLGKEGEKSIDRSTATEVAKRSQARWMMQGRILQTEPSFVITSQIVEVATGDVEASQRISGRPGETIFALVDRITTETLSDLSESGTPVVPPATSVADVSTTSEEAYRYYLEGVENVRKFFTQEARASFRKAIEHDSTFAMAHWQLRNWASSEEEETRALENAMRFADRATKRERMLIKAAKANEDGDFSTEKRIMLDLLDQYPDDKIALLSLQRISSRDQDYERAIEYGNRLIELDPLDKWAYNQLAYTYNAAGDVDKALWAINKYIELAPGEPNPYDSRADMYARNGRLDEAIASYKQAAEIKPDFADYASVRKLGCMYVFKSEYDKAAAEFRRAFASDNLETRAQARDDLISIANYRGRIEEAIRQIDAAIAADELEGVTGETHWFRYARKAFLLALVGEADAARPLMKQASDHLPLKTPFDHMFHARGYAYVGDFDKADQMLAPFDAKADSLPGILGTGYGYIRGDIAILKGDHASALSYLEKTSDFPWPGLYFVIGQANLGVGRNGEAIKAFEKILSWYDTNRVSDHEMLSRSHYYLGVAYEKAGRNSDAIKQLEIFLSIWDKADPRLKELGDAKKRLENLKRSS